jgi:anti-sigma regulatory factor (Ser/Thr protein kinase)
MQKSFERAISSLDAVFAFVDEFLETSGLPDAVGFPIRFVTEELFTNLVKYNADSPSAIELVFTKDADKIMLEFIDSSEQSFDLANYPEVDVDRPIEERTPGGLGIHLTKHLVDEIRYTFNAGISRTTLIKYLGSQ